MKKIILAAVAAFSLLAFCSIAEARVHPSQHNRYSANSVAEETDPITAILGGGNEDWGVSPQPRFKNQRQAKAFHEEQEANWGFGHASNSLVALGYDLQHRGFRVSEHPRFGGVHQDRKSTRLNSSH